MERIACSVKAARFLQDALRPLAERKRHVLIGVLWDIGHVTTYAIGTPPDVAKRLALIAVLWIAGSWGIGAAVQLTGSLSAAVMLHPAFNLWRAFPLVRNGPPW